MEWSSDFSHLRLITRQNFCPLATFAGMIRTPSRSGYNTLSIPFAPRRLSQSTGARVALGAGAAATIAGGTAVGRGADVGRTVAVGLGVAVALGVGVGTANAN